MATIAANPLMPKGLDPDDQLVWWILGTIARRNADGRWSAITVAELDAFGPEEWDGLVVDTPEIATAPLTSAQQTLVRLRLRDLETDDAEWWAR